MKKKKLLAISIVSLSIILTSFGVFAAESALTDAQKATIQGIVKTYYSGGNPINNLNINKSTKISDIVNEDSEMYQKIMQKFSTYKEGSILAGSIKDGASIGNILTSSLIYASINQDNFTSYKAMTLAVTDQLMEIANTLDSAERAVKEEKAAQMIDPSYGNIKFGKNSKGDTTLSVEKNNTVILQIDTANADKVISVLNACNNYDEFKAFLTELGIG